MLLATVAIPLLAALVVGLVPPSQRRWGWLAALLPATLFVWLLTQVGAVAGGAVLREQYPWVAVLDLNLSFALDGLSLLFALLITGIGTLILLYAASYLKAERRMWQFLSYLLLFMGAMLGLVLADNLLALFVFWELTSITSYLLVGFEHRSPLARQAARMALVVTGGGGLALLGAVLLLGQAVGSYEIPAVLAAGAQVQGSPLFGAILVLLLLAACTKSAQFPFHFWLPGAMTAPTPASAYLHSATMVKAGVYLLARLSPAFWENRAWSAALISIGLVTLVLGSLLALLQTDLKALLAYTTLAQLGAMVATIGLGPAAATVLVVTIFAHALYKAALFMASGSIQHATHTRDLRKLGGLAQAMPWTTGAVAVAASSMAGFPPLLGFLAKEKQIEALFDGGLPPVAQAATVAAVALAALCTVAVSLRLVWDALGRARATPYDHPPHEGAAPLVAGPLLLALLSVALVFAPPVEGLLGAAAGAIGGKSGPVPLAGALWHGVTPTLVVSIAAIALGVALFALRGRAMPLLLRASPSIAGAALFEGTLAAVATLGQRVGRRVETLSLRENILLVFLSLVALGGWSLLVWATPTLPAIDLAAISVHTVVVALLIPIGAVATVLAPTRLMAVTAVGITGAMVSLTFALYSAPDLAITQLLIETLSLVFLLIAFARLPRKLVERLAPATQMRDITVALLSGAVVTGLVLLTMGPSGFPSIAPYYVENSLALANGKNVVNVILVDFRGYDTLGEITVLCTAALGAYAVLRFARPAAKPNDLLGSPDVYDDGTPIAANDDAPQLKPLEERAAEPLRALNR